MEKGAHPLTRGSLPSYSPFLSFGAQSVPGRVWPWDRTSMWRNNMKQGKLLQVQASETASQHRPGPEGSLFLFTKQISKTPRRCRWLATVTPQGLPLRTSRQEVGSQSRQGAMGSGAVGPRQAAGLNFAGTKGQVCYGEGAGEQPNGWEERA